MKKRSAVRTMLTIVILIASVALIGWVLNNNKKKNAEKTAIVAESNGDIAVRITKVEKQALDLDFGVNGNFIPGQQMDFMSENAGRVTQVLVSEGNVVGKGQTLAVIKTDQLNVDLESAQANYHNALKDKERFENAFKTGGVTRQQLDQAHLNLSNAEARLAQAKIKIGDAYIRASINGVVNKRYIEPGAVVAPGTKLFEIVDISRLKLQIKANESQVANLKVGDKVKIKVNVFPDKDYTGTVTFIAAKSDEALSFPVEILLSANPGNQVKAGMYATAIFNFPSQAPAMLIPRSAFIGSVSSNQVFVVRNDSTAALRKVIAGRVMGDKVEVLQGLQEGETVITSGQINLSEGSPITVVK